MTMRVIAFHVTGTWVFQFNDIQSSYSNTVLSSLIKIWKTITWHFKIHWSENHAADRAICIEPTCCDSGYLVKDGCGCCLTCFVVCECIFFRALACHWISDKQDGKTHITSFPRMVFNFSYLKFHNPPFSTLLTSEFGIMTFLWLRHW